MAFKFELDREGVREILNSDEAGELVAAAARELADEIGDEADINEYSTDRRAASVAVPAYLQTLDGALTRAAAAVGLQVRSPR